MAARGDQRQADGNLDAQSATVPGEQPRQVRAEEASGRADAGTEQFARRQHHVHRQHRLRRDTVAGAAMAQRVLADAPAHRGHESRERAPERRAQAPLGQALAQCRPGDARAHGDDGVDGIDVDAVQSAGVEQHMAAGRQQIAIGIGRTAATRHHGHAGYRTKPHGRLQRRDRGGPHRRQRHAALRIDIAGQHVQRPGCGADAVGPQR